MRSLQHPSRFQRAKPFTLHCSLLLVVFAYAFAGGMVFNRLEAGALKQHEEQERIQKTNCLLRVFVCSRVFKTRNLKVLSNRSLLMWRMVNSEGCTLDETAQMRIADTTVACWKPEKDERSEWSFVTATLYGFGVVTTLGEGKEIRKCSGYNRIAPITYGGRLFCIIYGICGIPITMIIIANVGQYLNQFAGDSRRKVCLWSKRRRWETK